MVTHYSDCFFVIKGILCYRGVIMRKRGFNMYTEKNKGRSIYTRYTPKSKNHQEAEIRLYIGRSISRDVSKSVEEYVIKMAREVIGGFSSQRR